MSAMQPRRALRLTTVSRDALSSRNILCRRRAPMPVHWLDEDWLFDLVPAGRAVESEQFVECDWGGASVFVGVSRAAMVELAGASMPGEEAVDWPAPLLLAALEFAASALAQTVERVSRKSLRVMSIGPRPRTAGLDAYGWTVRSEQREFAGELLLDEMASRFMAATLREHPCVVTDTDWDALPMRLRLVVGWVDLSASALRSVEKRDVILLDECLLSGDNRLMVQLGPRLGVLCGLDGRSLEVLEGLQEIMADVDDSVAATSGIIDDVPVRLTFDLGEREISLGDLRSLQPGYLFNLGRDPKSTVSIRANGRLIGDGELVDIEGRVGVSLLHFNLESE